MNYSVSILFIAVIYFLSGIVAKPQKPSPCRSVECSANITSGACCLNEDCCGNSCCSRQRCVPYSKAVCDRTYNPCAAVLCITGTCCYVRPMQVQCNRPRCPPSYECQAYCE